jgi:hypothetical protein
VHNGTKGIIIAYNILIFWGYHPEFKDYGEAAVGYVKAVGESVKKERDGDNGEGTSGSVTGRD